MKGQVIEYIDIEKAFKIWSEEPPSSLWLNKFVEDFKTRKRDDIITFDDYEEIYLKPLMLFSDEVRNKRSNVLHVMYENVLFRDIIYSIDSFDRNELIEVYDKWFERTFEPFYPGILKIMKRYFKFSQKHLQHSGLDLNEFDKLIMKY